MQVNQSVIEIATGLVGVVQGVDKKGIHTVAFQVNAGAAAGAPNTQNQDGGDWVEYVATFKESELKGI